MEEYVAMDTNGNPVPLNTLLGKIPGSEITFTQKDPSTSKKRLLPPSFDEVYALMGLNHKSETEKLRNVGGFNVLPFFSLLPYEHFLTSSVCVE
jgi:hypothetical protein